MPHSLVSLRAPAGLRAAVAATVLLLAGGMAHAQAPAARPAPRTVGSDAAAIVAVVNGEAITRGDVANRARLFGLSTGIGGSPDVVARLFTQVTNQLIDERLKLREMQRRQIVVPDQQIAETMRNIEQRNNMPEGMMRRRLEADGVALRTMIDQIRVQIGWGQVVRQVLGRQVNVTDADIAQRTELLKSQIGQTEFRIGEIFVPAGAPGHAEDSRRFAETIIAQLRAGAPFPVVAAQFSQSQSALTGGDAGWVEGFELDPAVRRVVGEMPVGAISNPVQVAGGLSIIQLRARREIGREQTTVLSVRQLFYKFPTKLVADAPTEAQRQIIEKARRTGAEAKDCAAMEAAARALGDEKGGDPGELHLEQVQLPALRQMMATQPIGKASQPLIADDGVAVLMICSRDNKTAALPGRQELTERIIGERAELASRQLLRDLQRRSVIERRG